VEYYAVLLAEDLGMKAKLPLLDYEFKNYATETQVELKVREERGRKYGKWILRKSFERDLPDENTWEGEDAYRKAPVPHPLMSITRTRYRTISQIEKKEMLRVSDRVNKEQRATSLLRNLQRNLRNPHSARPWEQSLHRMRNPPTGRNKLL
jgi:asparagine synthetase B (glutamine-hydrolysing)